MSVMDWRSWKLDRTAKGTNGTETQGVYEAEDRGWRCRLFWALMHGEKLKRANAHELASRMESLLVTDSRGVYDAISMSESALLGMNNSRTGVDVTIIQEALRRDGRCYLTWVPSDMNLADSLTKATPDAYKVAATFLERKRWAIRFNEEFVSARKQQRLRRQQQHLEDASRAPLTPEWSSLFEEELSFPERD